MDTEHDGSTAQTVARALQLMEALAAADHSLGVTELARALALNKSTVHRLLKTLAGMGYVQQDPTTAHYCLGLRVLHLGAAVLNRLELRDQARPALQELSARTRETANLARLDGGEVVYIDRVHPADALGPFSRVGARAPVHCTALGKVLLACLPGAELERLLAAAELRPYTPRTITDPAELRRHLRLVANQGFAVDDEEHRKAVRGAAAPVRDFTGTVIAAVSISGSSQQLTPEGLAACIPAVVAAAGRISGSLGHAPRR